MNINFFNNLPTTSLYLSGIENNKSEIFLNFLYGHQPNPKDDLEFNEIYKQIKEFNFLNVPFSVLESYLIRNFSLLSPLHLSNEQRYQLGLFLETVKGIINQGAWPWQLIQGKTFLSYLVEYADQLPPETGIADCIHLLGKDSIKLFEEIVFEKIKISSILDKEDKIKRLSLLCQKTEVLVNKQFPGSSEYLQGLKNEMNGEEKTLKEFATIYQHLQSNLSDKEKIQLIKELREDFNHRHAFMAYLRARDDFSAISLFLDSISSAKWSFQAFREICLEKAFDFNTERFIPRDKSIVIKSVLILWHHYDANGCIFRDERFFTKDQMSAIDFIIKEKIIKRLFAYILNSIEHVTEGRLGYSIPSALDRIKTSCTPILLPLALFDHAMGLLLEPDENNQIIEATLYNTGSGLKNHPKHPDQFKFQTYLRKKISVSNLFNSNIWFQMSKMSGVNTPDPLYKLFHSFDSIPSDPLSNHPLDFEAPQATGSCGFQHMQAMVRDEFMKCEKLGSKENRYTAYRLVMSDFMTFIGSKRFPIENRSSILEGDNLEEKVLLNAWQEKELKLQSILQLIETFDPQQDQTVLECIYTQLTLAKDSKTELKPATKKLQDVLHTYWLQKHQRALDVLKNVEMKEFINLATVAFNHSKFKPELLKFIEEHLANEPNLIETFKKKIQND